MTPLAQRDFDADFYRFDGRNYEIEETPDALAVRQRWSVIVSRHLLAFIGAVLVYGFLGSSNSPLMLLMGSPVSSAMWLCRLTLHAL
ncbi:hypothetical protein EON80_23085, partial [bacterium]